RFHFFFPSRRRHTSFDCDWSSDVCSSDLQVVDEERFQLDLEVLQRNVELEALLIDDLLDLTRIAHGKLELHNDAVDIHGTLEHRSEERRVGKEERAQVRM